MSRNHRRVIDVLLQMERMFWRLSSKTEGFWEVMTSLGQRIRFGRNTQSFPSVKTIYARNILKHREKCDNRRPTSWILINRVGRAGHARNLVVGQTKEVN